MKKTFSTGEVASRIGVTRQTLYNWIESGLIDAPEPIAVGGAAVRMWTESHLTAARKAKGKLKPGRPKKRGVR